MNHRRCVCDRGDVKVAKMHLTDANDSYMIYLDRRNMFLVGADLHEVEQLTLKGENKWNN